MASFARRSNAISTQVFIRLPPCTRTVLGIQCRVLPPSTPSRRFLHAPAKKNPQKFEAVNAASANAKKFVEASTEASLKAPANVTPAAQIFSPQRAQTHARKHRDGLISQISTKNIRVALFQSTKHRGFLTRSYALATVCFTIAAYTFKGFYLDTNEGLPSWVPVAMGVVSLTWVGFGMLIITRPGGLVKKITAVPMRLGARQFVGLRIEGVRTSPLPAKTVEVSLSDCTIMEPAGGLSLMLKDARLKNAKARRARSTDPVVLRPFLWLGRAVSSLALKWVMQARQLLLGEQLVQMNVAGQGRWKIDINGSFPNGERVFDSLIKCR